MQRSSLVERWRTENVGIVSRDSSVTALELTRLILISKHRVDQRLSAKNARIPQISGTYLE
jgi:hypothetical protein